MKGRVLVGALLAAPALLVATATNGHAGAEKGSVAFAGRIEVVAGTTGSAGVCFDPLAGCLDGVATGAVLAEAVVGMRGSIGYTESCVGGVPVAAGTGDLSFTFTATIDGQLAPTDPVNARWVRAGLVAVIVAPSDSSYVAGGAAVVAPAPHTVPLCDETVEYVITGAMAFA